MVASVGTPKHLRLFRTNRVALTTQTFFPRAKDSNRDAVTVNRALDHRQPPRTLGTPLALGMAGVAFQHDPHHPVRGEQGAHLQDVMGRSHLPLRGKLDR